MERFDRAAGGAIVMDGQRVADERLAAVRAAVDAAGAPPIVLAAVSVGSGHPPTGLQVAATKAGLTMTSQAIAEDSGETGVEQLLRALAADPAVHGLLLQTPLPSGFHEEALLRLIPADKDVAGATATSLGRLMRGVAGLVGPTPLAVMRLLQRYEVPTAGRQAVVVGRSTHVGLPIALLLLRRGIDATVTVAHSRSSDLVAACRTADILVSAANRPGSIGAAHVKPGAAVIDVGYGLADNGMAGDVDFEEVWPVAGAITSAGSIRPLTLACLIENTLAAARAQGAVSR